MEVIKKYSYLKNGGELLSYVQGLRDSRKCVIALDIEAENNLHAYGERLCLIQVCDGTRLLLVDPLKMEDEAIRVLFESRDILKIMYDASGDLSLLKRVHGIDIVSILDLRPAVELLGYEKKDLASLIAAEMGIILRGKVKNQKRNWLIRPIDTHAIQYALDDVRYLLPLKDKIMTRLMEKGLMDRYILKNLQVQNKVLSENANDKYVKIAGYSNLQPHEQEIFRKVFDVRDDYAQMYNVPPFQVIGNRDLLGIARDLNHINRLHFSAALGVNAIKELMSDLKATVGTSKSTN
ncbi:hypothetical protein ACFLUU_06850 [Chloroflexota bacterium]